jgi:hypothetical protein
MAPHSRKKVGMPPDSVWDRHLPSIKRMYGRALSPASGCDAPASPRFAPSALPVACGARAVRARRGTAAMRLVDPQQGVDVRHEAVEVLR